VRKWSKKKKLKVLVLRASELERAYRQEYRETSTD
jgi:hypothetical protein